MNNTNEEKRELARAERLADEYSYVKPKQLTISPDYLFSFKGERKEGVENDKRFPKNTGT